MYQTWKGSKMKASELNAEEAEKLYQAEWPILNERLKNATAKNNLVEAKKCRQQLSYLSQRYIARKHIANEIEEPIKEATKLEEALDKLYTKGYLDKAKEKSWNPRGCEEWQAALELFNANKEETKQENASDKLDEVYNGSCKSCED